MKYSLISQINEITFLFKSDKSPKPSFILEFFLPLQILISPLKIAFNPTDDTHFNTNITGKSPCIGDILSITGEFVNNSRELPLHRGKSL